MSIAEKDGGSYVTACEVCNEKPSVHTHHRKLRSQGGGDEDTNTLRVCLGCHSNIHANPSESYARGLLVHSWADPADVEIYAAVEAITHADEVTPIAEGEPCPTCKRRVPHKKKASTPKSRVFSTRIPLDNADSFSELVDAAAEHHGLTERPYHRYLALLFGVTLLLQAKKGDLPVG